MTIECFAALNKTKMILSTTEGSEIARQLLARDAGMDEIIETFVALSDDAEISRIVRLEMAELPEIVVSTILAAWALAESGGKELRLQSVPPAKPLEFARSRKVEVAIEMDETGVTVSLSHVPGRHAEWYRVAERVA